ncbi:DUF3331 domain-containing protein [Paraburkholderia sp. DHOC27]|uniref:DUF3331 domain-containing protein n=1 Tax=Paraburkholderia sp. DHOC27 TaxID=2303330 RepID=UPI000E3C9280|nr:DUF3331 domain-containing protein [Paraburkholderia sp. DHOC27]RFU49721.1 DUF3331 domain-containing protein [Paraburkholderia sp. DHOC27]
MDIHETGGAWKHTLTLLMQLSSPCVTDGTTRTRCKRAKHVTTSNRTTRLDRKRAVHLHIVERDSASTITVCWRDATLGCYGEQLWKAVTARTGATCALSGLRIRRGDAVFRPLARGYIPVNVEAMILASAVEEKSLQSG